MQKIFYRLRNSTQDMGNHQRVPISGNPRTYSDQDHFSHNLWLINGGPTDEEATKCLIHRTVNKLLTCCSCIPDRDNRPRAFRTFNSEWRFFKEPNQIFMENHKYGDYTNSWIFKNSPFIWFLKFWTRIGIIGMEILRNIRKNPEIHPS